MVNLCIFYVTTSRINGVTIASEQYSVQMLHQDITTATTSNENNIWWLEFSALATADIV